MPSIKEMQKNKRGTASENHSNKNKIEMPHAEVGEVRRPHQEDKTSMDATPNTSQNIADDTKTEPLTDLKTMSQDKMNSQSQENIQSKNDSKSKQTKSESKKNFSFLPPIPSVSQLVDLSSMGVSIGASMIKSKFPKTYDLASTVVTDWVQDGNFSELPIETPIVQFYVGESLRKAKSLEKKVETKLNDIGVLPVVKHQIHQVKKRFKK